MYVLDGKTLNILKRIDMPVADRLHIKATRGREPRHREPARRLRAHGDEPARPAALRRQRRHRRLPGEQRMIPPAVRIGDFTQDGTGDIVIGANFVPETGATAHPDSQCAATAGATLRRRRPRVRLPR